MAHHEQALRLQPEAVQGQRAAAYHRTGHRVVVLKSARPVEEIHKRSPPDPMLPFPFRTPALLKASATLPPRW